MKAKSGIDVDSTEIAMAFPVVPKEQVQTQVSNISEIKIVLYILYYLGCGGILLVNNILHSLILYYPA